jgi:hypothetical protein
MKLKPVKDGHGQLCAYSFHCPGCDHLHLFYVSGHMIWSFDGNMEKPTFTPSLLNRCPGHPDPKRHVCHLNLTAGKLYFHSDCTHDMVGKVFELPELPELV